MISYSLVSDSKGQSLTLVYTDGETVSVPQTHPNYKQVRDLLLDDDTDVEALDEDHVKDLLNVVARVGDRLRHLSDRVRVSGNNLYFDGDVLDNALADHILRLIQDDDEGGYRPLVAFLEKVATNPSKDSQDSLFSWLKGRNFTINTDGDFVAYKGVKIGADNESLSIHSGKAFVNGEVVEGFIPNPLGAVIEMPRSKVNDDTAVGCSTGLHAGTWDYASNFANGRVLTVLINPRDVVSVPTDCAAAKLRVSRYTVQSEVAQPYSTPTYYAADVEGDDEDEDEDYDDEDYWGDGEDDDY